MSDWMRNVLESKRAARLRLQGLSFPEKIKLLERLRQRSLAIAQSPLRQRQTRQASPPFPSHPKS